MLSLTVALFAASLSTPAVAFDSVRCVTPLDSSAGVAGAVCGAPLTDTIPRRRHAIEYSDWYNRRLTIHRIGSFTMLPLFGAEYLPGDQLLHGDEERSGVKGAHVAVGIGIGTLFTVNTVTGLWNLWDARSDPAGRTRRTLHAITMLASDAGFVWTGAIADAAKRSDANARRHRNVALGSIGVATIGTAMMWLWKG